MVLIGWFRTTCACKQVRSEKSVSRNVNRHADGAVRNTLKSLFALAMRPEQHVPVTRISESRGTRTRKVLRGGRGGANVETQIFKKLRGISTRNRDVALTSVPHADPRVARGMARKARESRSATLPRQGRNFLLLARKAYRISDVDRARSAPPSRPVSLRSWPTSPNIFRFASSLSRPAQL